MRAGISQNDLERMANMAIGQVNRIESGIRGAELPIETVVALAQALEVPLEKLVYGPEPRIPLRVRCMTCLDVPERRKWPSCPDCGRPAYAPPRKPTRRRKTKR
jgi:transcriptional regulator with XRE-family HTH domain